MPRIKGYTLYFYTPNRSCLTYFSIDGTTKKMAVKLGREIAKLLEEYYGRLPWKVKAKITVEVEEYSAFNNHFSK